MKRTSSALVEYVASDSDNENPEDTTDETNDLQQPKRRKLPPLPSSLVVPVPIDNPRLHQGRIRTTPHVEGQFAAHVYVSLTVSRHSRLYKTIQHILSDAKKAIPSLHDIWSVDSKQLELHVSVSRPIFLRAYQKEEFKRAVKNIATIQTPFQVSFTTLSELKNDEKTRTFLTMEIGAGFHEMRSLSEALSPALRSIRQQGYYSNPKFHASISWALLHKARKTSPTGLSHPPSTSKDDSVLSRTLDKGATSCQEFPTISCLPQEVLATLNGKYCDKLSSPKDGIFSIEAVTLRIGKETFTWKFARPSNHSDL